MANFKTHLITGAAVGASAFLVSNWLSQSKKIDTGEQPAIDGGALFQKLLLGAGIGAAAGVLPDILEPATNPFHRSTCHSVLFGVALCLGVKALTNSGLPEEGQACLHSATAAYLSHLFLDLLTPMSLPII